MIELSNYFLKTNDGKYIKNAIYNQGGNKLDENRGGTLSARGSHAFIVCFDMTNLQSFENVKKHIDKINKYFLNNNTKIILVGTQSDLSEKIVVTKDMMEAVRKDLDLGGCMTCSAKTGENIDSLFELTNKLCLENEKKVTDQLRLK